MTIRKANRTECHSMVMRHYLHRWPAIVAYVLGLISDNGSLVGVCVFAFPPRETNKRYGVRQSLELARLFIEDSMPKHTESWFIARALRWLKQNAPSVELVVSYADPSAHHQGTIYKASNWIFDGRTDQERKTPRFDYRVGGHLYRRRAHVPSSGTVVRVPRVSKFRFYYRLRP